MPEVVVHFIARQAAGILADARNPAEVASVEWTQHGDGWISNAIAKA